MLVAVMIIFGKGNFLGPPESGVKCMCHGNVSDFQSKWFVCDLISSYIHLVSCLYIIRLPLHDLNSPLS